MSRSAAPLAALMACGLLVSGCANTSGSAATAASAPARSTPATSAPAPTSAAAAVPEGANSAKLDYTAPGGNPDPEVHKTVTGATYQRLAADLADLKPIPAGTAMCNVLTAETATITVTSGGHTNVYFVEGVPCRGVRLTINGVQQPLLAGSVALINQVRAIAGTSGLAHPLPKS